MPEVCETAPDFKAMLEQMHASGRTDDQIADELAEAGLFPDRSAISNIRLGRTKQPRYVLGSALIRIYEAWKGVIEDG